MYKDVGGLHLYSCVLYLLIRVSLSVPLYIYIYIYTECAPIYVCIGGVCPYIYIWGHAVAQLVEALRYQPEGRGFNSR